MNKLWLPTPVLVPQPTCKSLYHTQYKAHSLINSRPTSCSMWFACMVGVRAGCIFYMPQGSYMLSCNLHYSCTPHWPTSSAHVRTCSCITCMYTHVASITTDLIAQSPEVCFGLESKLLGFVFTHQQAG